MKLIIWGRRDINNKIHSKRSSSPHRENRKMEDMSHYARIVNWIISLLLKPFQRRGKKEKFTNYFYETNIM